LVNNLVTTLFLYTCTSLGEWVSGLNNGVQYFAAILVDNLDRAPETLT